MCWNASVSLNTFLLGAFAIELALFNGVIPLFLAAYYLSYVSMQLIEYFLWKNLNTKSANAFWSKVALASVLIQPVFAILYIGVKDPVTWVLLGLYLAFITYVITVVKPLSTIDFSTERAENGHLRWNWLKFPIWVMVIWLGFCFFENVYHRRWIDALWKTVLVGVIYFTYVQSGTWGSMWCWIANTVSIYLLWLVFSTDICGYVKKKFETV